jgi:ABC-type iron transport system FetAB permease component
MTDEIPPTPTLRWVNVGLGLTFILFDVATSAVLGLGVGRSLLTAALRCILQLALVAGLLQKVFEAENPWAVAGISCKHGSFRTCRALTIVVLCTVLLNLLGTFEIG